jgi:hypothetical protein
MRMTVCLRRQFTARPDGVCGGASSTAVGATRQFTVTLTEPVHGRATRWSVLST